jgi:site-specific DNA-methyltransferase (adenine-specific)
MGLRFVLIVRLGCVCEGLGMLDLRFGDWRDELADVECDALIADPPYSEKTHAGNWAGCTESKDPSLARKGIDDKRSRRKPISYAAWTDVDAEEFVAHWSSRVSGWMVLITDDILAPAIRAAGESAGRYVFSAIPFVEIGKCPRMNGDGPASWTCWVIAMRPKERRFMSWGSLPGAYCFRKGSIEQVKLVTGGKPLRLMDALVRDYSRPGDLVCDPFAGGGTTALACSSLGRRFVGSEIDPETYAAAMKRLSGGVTLDLFGGAA